MPTVGVKGLTRAGTYRRPLEHVDWENQFDLTLFSHIFFDSLSGSIWTAFTDLELGPDLALTYMFVFIFLYFVVGC